MRKNLLNLSLLVGMVVSGISSAAVTNRSAFDLSKVLSNAAVLEKISNSQIEEIRFDRSDKYYRNYYNIVADDCSLSVRVSETGRVTIKTEQGCN